MFIILSIYSKNTNSLTNFLKFFYKLDKKKILRLNLYAKQFQKKKSFSFVVTLSANKNNDKAFFDITKGGCIPYTFKICAIKKNKQWFLKGIIKD